MQIHEYQAKSLLAGYGVPSPLGLAVSSPAEAAAAARTVGGRMHMVKAQLHAGGRRKAGGVREAGSPAEAEAAARALLGRKLVTEQTGPEGRMIRQVYVEGAVGVSRLLYVAALVDARSGMLSLIGSRTGGEDVEARLLADPKGLISQTVPIDGDRASPIAAFADRLELGPSIKTRACEVFAAMVDAMIDLDAGMIEINPLAVTDREDIVALDLKVVLDDNALFRHSAFEELRDDDDDPIEFQAQRHEINYVRMDGNIGLVVNGAGLALATIDMLVDAGGRPANFMDIRSTATSLDIARGLDLLYSDPKVEAVLVNVHAGGMTRCDTIAEAVGISNGRTGRRLPLVFRAAGFMDGYSKTVLKNTGVAYTEAADMQDAVAKIVALANRRKGAA